MIKRGDVKVSSFFIANFKKCRLKILGVCLSL